MGIVAALGRVAATLRATAAAANGRIGAVAARPVLGAIGFCTRVPVGASEAAWHALVTRPWGLVVAAYPLGAALALALVPPVSPATTALLLPLAVVGLAGITHLDGLADVADAAVVHGDAQRRRNVLRDTEVGVGAAVVLGLALAGLALAGLALASASLAAAAALVVAAEVGAKLGMATLAGLGPSTFGELGSQLEDAGAATALAALFLAVPAALGATLVLGTATGLAAGVAVLAGPPAALAVGWWASGRLDGVNGDCFGATNELARLAGLHLGLAALRADVALQTDAVPTIDAVLQTGVLLQIGVLLQTGDLLRTGVLLQTDPALAGLEVIA